MVDAAAASGDSFPRRQARTQRFTLGEPRNLRVADDGSRVAFLRSSGPYDTANALWVLDVDSGVERLIADPRKLSADLAAPELPAAERARRERARETGSGIVTYDADDALSAAVFALDGRLWRVSLVAGGPPPVALEAQPGAFDPKLSPDRALVAYVADSTLRVTGVRDDAAEGVAGLADRVVAADADAAVSWGVAEFVAAEEMGRSRGYWWSPDGRRLLAARVDHSPVPQWWIADPARPDSGPTPTRYPAAGCANARVGLAVFGVGDESEERDGDCTDVAWDDDGWEYLAGVRWSTDGLLLTVQTRDQRTLGILEADPDTGACRLLRRITDDAWVDLVPGVPRLLGSRLLTVEDLNSGEPTALADHPSMTDTSSALAEDSGSALSLCVDGEALTPDDVQVRAVHHADDTGAVITASVDPAEVHVARVSWRGEMHWLTDAPGVHGVAVGGDTTVISRRSLDRPGCRRAVRSARRRGPDRLIGSYAAEPALELNVEIVELGPRRLMSALVMPSGGSDGPLPVLLDPYGGPHAQRVQRADALFHTSQWFADQGFAVLVVDGRGTPGRGPAFERSVRGDLAGPVLADQIDALTEAARLDQRLDLSRVAIRGWSFGGYLAALAVLRRPDVFAAAIAGAPVTDWRLYDTHYTERYLGHPDTEPANYERCDLTPLAPRLRRPLMLIHGLADDNVVAAHTLRLSQALTEAGRPHTVLPLSGVTHMTPQEEVAENLLLLQLRFLQDSLGVAPR